MNFSPLSMKLRAYAKINLGLRLISKRPDGYHELETVFHQINLFDELELSPSDALELSTNSPDVPADSRNLCIRAAQLLQQEYGVSSGVQVRLDKRIPVGAGLGGGSTDAAAVLNGLLKLWKLPRESKKLESIAAVLGSDVPFFLSGGTAHATGRGELLRPFELKMPYWILVITPPIHVSTAWAYSQVRVPNGKPGSDMVMSLTRMMITADGSKDSAYLTNDFEPLVFESYPEIKKLKESMLSGGCDHAFLSGTGSSVFGLLRDGGKATALADQFPRSYRSSLTAPNFRPVADL